MQRLLEDIPNKSNQLAAAGCQRYKAKTKTKSQQLSPLGNVCWPVCLWRRSAKTMRRARAIGKELLRMGVSSTADRIFMYIKIFFIWFAYSATTITPFFSIPFRSLTRIKSRLANRQTIVGRSTRLLRAGESCSLSAIGKEQSGKELEGAPQSHRCKHQSSQ